MVSDFRLKKLLYIFTFFDTDKSGAVDKKDFEIAIDRTAKARGWQPGDEAFKVLQDRVLAIWAGLQSQADADNDGQVTKEEWINLWDEYAKNAGVVAEWQKLFCKHIFTLQDSANDGKIDAEEFSTVCESFGLKKAESVDAFKKLSSGKDTIDWAEFQELWQEYFASEDANSPGNYIFGYNMLNFS